MNIKVLSWNIWIDGNFGQVADFLKSANAEIIGLQEVQADIPERDIISYLAKLGYDHIFAPIQAAWGGKVYNFGPAVFSKFPIKEKQTYILSKENGRAAAKASIEVNDVVLQVFSTHPVHTHQFESDLQREQITNLLKLIPNERAVLMGDFNATPASTVIKDIKKVLVDSDTDSLPTWSVYPEECKKCNLKGIEIKLDYIFTTKDIKTNSFKVESSKASDHLPISVNIEL